MRRGRRGIIGKGIRMIGMSGVRRGAGWMLAVAIVLAATEAAAQTPLDDGSGTSTNRRQQHRGASSAQPKQAPLPEIKVTPQPWPRLDPGAVFCRTAEDFRQHLAFVSARLDGNRSGYAEAAGCRVIRAPTPVAVLAREAPGRTQIQISGAAGETGWTDAFLPDKGGKP